MRVFLHVGGSILIIFRVKGVSVVGIEHATLHKVLLEVPAVLLAGARFLHNVL